MDFFLTPNYSLLWQHEKLFVSLAQIRWVQDALNYHFCLKPHSFWQFQVTVAVFILIIFLFYCILNRCLDIIRLQVECVGIMTLTFLDSFSLLQILVLVAFGFHNLHVFIILSMIILACFSKQIIASIGFC